MSGFATMSVLLDIAAEGDSLLPMLIASTDDYESITYRVVDGLGPAGWPVVLFVGDVPDLTAFVLDYCAGDTEQAKELLEVD